MSHISSMISENSLTAFVQGKPYTAKSDHPNYKRLVDALKAGDEEAFLKNIDIPTTIKKYTKGKVEVVDGIVMYDGEAWHNTFTKHILRMMNEGFSCEPLIRCFEKLMQNPSKRAIDEFYPWCEHHGLVITEDGDVLGYKQVRPDYKDWYSNSIDNSVGAKIPEMKRSKVDDNWGVACSQGYHVGALSYVQNFHNGEGHCMVVKFNPANVVTVPSSETNKLRVTVYEVVQELTDLAPLDKALYTNQGNEYCSEDDDWCDDDFEDDIDDEDIDDDELDDEECDEDSCLESDSELEPPFLAHDKVYHINDKNTHYTVNHDAVYKDGEWKISITHKGYTDYYPANMFFLV